VRVGDAEELGDGEDLVAGDAGATGAEVAAEQLALVTAAGAALEIPKLRQGSYKDWGVLG